MHWKLSAAVLWIFLTGSGGGAAATYEVAQRNPLASDDGAGTRERPWKTLAKAAAEVQPGDEALFATVSIGKRCWSRSAELHKPPLFSQRLRARG